MPHVDLSIASTRRYVTQLPQGRNAARVSGLLRVRGGFRFCEGCESFACQGGAVRDTAVESAL